jgi:apolipoprotein N-acyltransferase
MKKTTAFLTLLAISLYSLAQDSTSVAVTSTERTETTTWYTQPWAWVVGGAVFILLLVALVKSGGSKNSNA